MSKTDFEIGHSLKWFYNFVTVQHLAPLKKKTDIFYRRVLDGCTKGGIY